MVPLDIRARMPASFAHGGTRDGLRVAVLTFADQRPEKRHLGARSHIFGGETYFNVPGGDPGVSVAQALADYLRQSGWQAWHANPGITVPGETAEVVLSGQVADFHADARSRVFSTEITSSMRIIVQAKNVEDGSVNTLTMSGAASDVVFWFSPEDVQAILNEAVANTATKLLSNLRIENRKLRTL
jgi:hypothetical protein